MGTQNLKKEAKAENNFSIVQQMPTKSVKIKFPERREKPSERKPMATRVKENKKSFLEGIKPNGDLASLENWQIVDHKIESSEAKISH